MKHTTEAALYSTNLVLGSNKLLYENRTIYDFNDRYSNLSPLSIEQQLEVFHNLIKAIYSTNLHETIKVETLIVLGHLFKSLSASNASSSVLSIGGSVLNSAFPNIVRAFRDDNQFIELQQMNSFSGQSFSVIVINWEFAKPNFEAILNLSKQLIAKHGKIICFACRADDLERCTSQLNEVADVSLYRLSPERIVVSADVVRMEMPSGGNDAQDQILHLVKSIQSDIGHKMQFILSSRPTSADDEWHRLIDALIQTTAEVETIVASGYALFGNKDLKFQTNEFKNALLDLKYEAHLNRGHYDFFLSALKDRYANWVNGAY